MNPKGERITAINRRTRQVAFEYPEGTPAYRRGFTPAGSALLNFPIMRRLETKPERLGIPAIARKPTNGSKRIFQVIGNKVIHHTRPLRNQKPLFTKEG